MGTLTKVALGIIGQLKPDRAKARATAPSVALPKPQMQGGIPLMQAIALRRSDREFAPTPLPQQVLSDLLWAAFGINRPEGHGRTAPTAMGAQEIDVYVALPDGLYIYEPFAHALSLVAGVDARKVTGFQDFVDDAPLDLVYVADHAHMDKVPSDQRDAYSAVAAEPGAQASTVLKRAPTSVAARTSAVETPIMMMPSAESLPQSPSSANLRICTASTSVPGRESTTETVSSRTNMAAMRIHAETIPGISSGATMRRMVVR